MPIVVSHGRPDAAQPAAPTRHVEHGVRMLFEPSLALAAAADSALATGDLLVTESSLVWFDPASTTTISVDYPSIVIHAVAREGDPQSEGRPCIYCQLTSDALDQFTKPRQASTTVSKSTDTAAGVIDTPSGGDHGDRDAGASGLVTHGDDDHVDDSEPICELRILPNDTNSLDAIYQAMCDCAALHPDADTENDMDDQDGESGEEDGDDNGWVFDAQTAQELVLSDAGQAAFAHIESVFGVTMRGGGEMGTATNGDAETVDRSGQFDDPDEER